MTLLVVERFEGTGIRLLSDSRLSYPSKYVDAGVKVLACPVRVWNVDERGVQAPLIYDATIGIGIAGSALRAHSAVEAVRNVLLSLQRIESYTDWSLHAICRPIARVVGEVAEEFGLQEKDLPPDQPEAAFVVIGLCPSTQKPRAYVIELFWRELKWHADIRELLLGSGREFFGSGAAAARAVDPSKAPNAFAILRAVIDSNRGQNKTGVGGWIQCGECIGAWVNDRPLGWFDVKAVRHVLGNDGEPRHTDRWSGIEWYGESSTPGWSDLQPRVLVSNPFHEEYVALIEKAAGGGGSEPGGNER